MKVSVSDLINRRRRQILVHSFIYYRENNNIISDHTFDAWCNELVKLQERYPHIAEECDWHEAFKDFDGSTGVFLPLHDHRVMNMAHKAKLAHKNYTEKAT